MVESTLGTTMETRCRAEDSALNSELEAVHHKFRARLSAPISPSRAAGRGTSELSHRLKFQEPCAVVVDISIGLKGNYRWGV